jgi:hypothetical protein
LKNQSDVYDALLLRFCFCKATAFYNLENFRYLSMTPKWCIHRTLLSSIIRKEIITYVHTSNENPVKIHVILLVLDNLQQEDLNFARKNDYVTYCMNLEIFGNPLLSRQ